MNSQTGNPWRRANCPVCGADRPAFLTHDWQTVAGRRYTFDLVRCQICGMVYINPRLNREAVTGTGGGGAWHDALQVNRPIYEAGCRRLKAILRAPGTPALLDIGCAYGDFPSVASEHGFSVTSLEIDQQVAAAARARGFVVYDEPLEHLSLPGESFDVITLWDVIEHLNDPKSLLRAALCLLRPGGLLSFHSGNAAFQVTKGRILGVLRPGKGPYNAPFQHVSHFSPGTARRLLCEVGDFDHLEFDHLEFGHLDTLRYQSRPKYLAMKTYNKATRWLNRAGLPLWTTSLVAFARKAG